jgi:hypothetical protein
VPLYLHHQKEINLFINKINKMAINNKNTKENKLYEPKKTGMLPPPPL